jgi:hypothetical protein
MEDKGQIRGQRNIRMKKKWGFTSPLLCDYACLNNAPCWAAYGSININAPVISYMVKRACDFIYSCKRGMCFLSAYGPMPELQVIRSPGHYFLYFNNMGVYRLVDFVFLNS